MWNSRKCTAMAVLGVGLAVAAATPASAQWLGWGGAYGAGGCGGYGYAGGCGGFGAYGYAPAYAGVYSYGWPYATVGYGAYGAYDGCGAYGGYGGCGAYGYAGDCGGYGAYGYAPAYYGYGYGAYGYGGCRHRVRGYGGYALAYTPRHRSGYAYAAYTPQKHIYASAYGLKRHFVMKQGHQAQYPQLARN